MNELDAIKKRAAERRIRRERYSTLGNPELATEAEADLDRAIAIADAATHCSCFSRMTVVRTTKELAIVPANIEHDRFRDELNRLTEVRCTLCGTMFYVATFDELYQERDELRVWALEAEHALAEEGIGPVLPVRLGGDNRGWPSDE